LYLRIPPKNKKRGKKKSGGQSHGRRFHPLVARALGINQPSIMGDEKEVFSEREASMARSMLMGNSDTKVYTVVLGFTQTIGSNAGTVRPLRALLMHQLRTQFSCHTDDMFPRTTVYAKSHSESANVWAPTSTSTVIGSIKWYADTLSVTTTYGRILVHYKTEFRFVQ